MVSPFCIFENQLIGIIHNGIYILEEEHDGELFGGEGSQPFEK
jgi:hypothetical protein